ncbi:MAG TPA: glyoxalase superfamily protein [Candidatus Baltobacteraceae bacterium]|nr:glyoxalase superfamily protein [Candidatus Baltobacteraceae bacterium]
MTPSFKQTIPVLRIFDVAKAREFYIDYLGFSVDFEHRFSETAPLFMGISRGGVVLFLSEHHGDGTPGTHVIARMSGLDDYHAELKAKNYRYMNPGIQEQEWGTREMGVVDPFGNRISFSEPIEK